MIFHISQKFIDSCGKHEVLCTVIEKIIANRHFISADKSVKTSIKNIIQTHGGTLAKEKFQKGKMYDITGELRKYLTTIEIYECISIQAFDYLTSRKALLVCENKYYEWPAYKRIIDAYSTDPMFGNLFKFLRDAKDKERIDCEHLGGCTQLPSALKSMAYNIGGQNLAIYKTCTLLDRDTESPDVFSPNQRDNIELLTGKRIQHVTNDDIYTLSQPGHKWHMWYWKAIENYFPDSAYESYGYDIANIPAAPVRHWTKISDCFKGTVKSYKKSELPKLGTHMNRTDYERDVQKFNIAGNAISEIQLLLLKLVQII